MNALKLHHSRVASVLFVLLMAAMTPMASLAQTLDGLVAYYPFNGNATDQSGNGNDGVEQGGIQYEQGISGESVSFDGIDDYVRVPSNPSLNPVDQLSISFWAKIDGFTNVWSPIVHKGGPDLGGAANREYTVWLQNTSSFLLASAGDSSSQNYSFACCAHFRYWTHFVGVVDRRNQRMKIYVDGVLKVDANDPYSTFNNNNYDLLFGWTKENNASFSPFKGRIDELRIYNRALTEDEVKASYDEHSPAQPVTFIGLWENFPDTQGDNGFFTYGYASVTDEYRLLSDAGSYFFNRPEEGRWHNPNIWRSDEPFVFMNPSGTASNTGYPEDAVLAWVVPETAYYDLIGNVLISGSSCNGIDANGTTLRKIH